MDYNVNNQPQNQFKHKCGQCELGFNTEEEYATHDCVKTGVKPTDPRSMGENWEEISARAVARGGKRKELEAIGVDPEAAKEQAEKEVAKLQFKPNK